MFCLRAGESVDGQLVIAVQFIRTGVTRFNAFRPVGRQSLMVWVSHVVMWLESQEKASNENMWFALAGASGFCFAMDQLVHPFVLQGRTY